MDFTELVFMSVMVEGIVSYISTFKVGCNCLWKVIASVGIGVLVAINFQIDVFEMVGFSSTIPYMSKILTGIVIGRGSNYVNDFLKLMGNYFGSNNHKNNSK
ncbi:MAG: hypothetical protein PHF89_07440 [Eubacteriales bacterium]|nr:hypothetical protein [Eubacteriales bacterium]